MAELQPLLEQVTAARKSLVRPTAMELEAARASLDLAIASLAVSPLGEAAQHELRREMRHIRALLAQAALVLEEWQNVALEGASGRGAAYGQDGSPQPPARAGALRLEA
ncbi:MAG: hypothetical protein SFV54_06460 [Bryobacteraceae bacterium]|nr:hypothetical protein [Bryobacteraceae bacterium]